MPSAATKMPSSCFHWQSAKCSNPRCSSLALFGKVPRCPSPAFIGKVPSAATQYTHLHIQQSANVCHSIYPSPHPAKCQCVQLNISIASHSRCPATQYTQNLPSPAPTNASYPDKASCCIQAHIST